jgi:hypothetical protein
MPGTGGSKDALSATVNPNQFAIVPTLGTAYGAYDPLWYSGSSIAPGTTIHLGAANSIGLAAGTYAVLPARYALLAGAYLVSAKTGTQDLPANAVAPNSDGSVVVAGYLSFGNTTIGGNRYTGYTVTTGAQARRIAEYTDYKAGAFFAAKPAGNDGFTRQLPADAARLVLSVTQALAAAGQVNGRPASGGVGAAVEISAPSLEIVGSGPATTPGAVQIAASTLQSWQPGRLLLGGVRTATGANSVQVTSSTVHVDAGTSLTAPEITMVATGQVLVDAGAHLATPSAAADGSAPAVALAANPVALSLTGPGATGASFVSLSDFGY